MKQLFILVVLCVSHLGLAKNEIYTLKKTNEIELHNSIQSLISAIDIKNLSTNNQKFLKQNLTELASQLKELNTLSKSKTFEADYGQSLYIKYKYENFNYYYNYSEIDTTLSFENQKIKFSKYEIIEDDDNLLVYSYDFKFDWKHNLRNIDIDQTPIHRQSEYNENGDLLNHELKVKGEVVGKTYDTQYSTGEIPNKVANLLNIRYSKTSTVIDYSGTLDSLPVTEYLLDYQDTAGYSQGYVSRKHPYRKIGTWKTYYVDSGLALAHNYQLNENNYQEINGYETYYYSSGDTAISQYYKNGKLNGKRTVFFTQNKPGITEAYNNGILIGERTTYFKNGKIKAIEKYSDRGVAIGTWLTYEYSGKLERHCHYVNGNYERDYMLYSNGILIDSSYYVAGKIENTRIKYYDYLDADNNRIISDLINYKNGELNGEYLSFYANGTPLDSSFYNDGKKHGKSTQFYENGVRSRRANYNHGTLLNYVSQYKSGKKKQTYVLNPETELANDTSYYENGIISEIKAFEFIDNQCGHWLTKDVDGNLTSDIIYHGNGTSDGFTVEKDGDDVDSILYNSKQMTNTYKGYRLGKLIYHRKVTYGITTEYFRPYFTKKEEGFLRKKTYNADLRDMDEEEEWDKAYKEDYLIGEETSYYLNGNKKDVKIRPYQGDDWESKTTFYKNGSIKTIETNEDYGDGIIEINFNRIGQITSSISEMDEFAIFNNYYKNDSLKQNISYNGSRMETTNYYPNGNIQSETYIEESGEYDYYSKSYYDFGDFYTKHEKYYNENGIITKEIRTSPYDEEKSISLYKNGKLDIVERYYFYEGYEENGELTSRSTFYPDGKIKSYQYYEYSEIHEKTILVRQENYYESGGIKSVKRWGEYTEKIGDWIYYNDDTEFGSEGEIIKEPTIKEQH